MKNRSKYGYVSALLLIVLAGGATLTFSGCNKRPYTRIKELPLEVKLDWSGVAAADQNNIPSEHFKLFLFQEDGTLRAQYSLTNPKETQILPGVLQVGTYKAICVNEDPRYVQVENSDKFETTRLAAREASSSISNLFGKADETEKMVVQPGWIFSGVLPEIKVGDPLITVDDEKSTIVVPMARRVKVVNFNFTVTGVTDEIKTVRAALGGVASKIDLTTGEIVSGFHASSPVELTYSADGTRLVGTMLIFGNEAELDDALTNNLKLSFETESGRVILQEKDITEQMKTGDVEGDLQIKIEGNVDVRFDVGLGTLVITWTLGSEENVDGL